MIASVVSGHGKYVRPDHKLTFCFEFERGFVCMKKLLAFMVCLVFVFVACDTTPAPTAPAGNTNSTTEENGLSGTIVVAGSTTVTPLMRALSYSFEAAHSGVIVEVQELGTSAGINATIGGTSHIAMASRSLTDEEQAQGLIPIPFAIDGVAVIVHESNPVDNLTIEQITAIFRGEITNWSEVGGPDAGITVVSREAGSGIRSTFESFANLLDEFEVDGEILMASAIDINPPTNLVISSGTGGVIASVSGNPNAVGYVTTGVVGAGINDVAVNGVQFSAQTLADGSYYFANSFLIGVMDNIPDIAQAFVDFILSAEGQSVVAENDYAPVS